MAETAKNRAIASIFFEMADILDMQGVAWKPRAYRQAARSLISLNEDISDIYKKQGAEALEEIPGVGEKLAKKIEEFIKTGKIQAYEKMRREYSPHISLLVKVPGMGPKKAMKLFENLKISSLAELEAAAKSGKIRGMPGFGEKSEKEILESMAIMRKSKGRIPLKKAEKIAEGIISWMKGTEGIEQISAAGSLRRKKKTIGDIDILASSSIPEKAIERFAGLNQIDRIIAKGHTKASAILKSGVQADLRVVSPKSFGAGLFYFTGSKNYNIKMRKEAIKKGMKLSEYGLFDKKTGKMAAGKTEEEICKKLGARLLKPEDRDI